MNEISSPDKTAPKKRRPDYFKVLGFDGYYAVLTLTYQTIEGIRKAFEKSDQKAETTAKALEFFGTENKFRTHRKSYLKRNKPRVLKPVTQAPINYHEIVLHADHFFALRLGLSDVEGLKYGDIKTTAKQVRRTVEAEKNAAGPQLFLGDSYNDQLDAVSRAESFFVTKAIFDNYKTVWLRQNKRPEIKATPKPRGKDYFAILGFSISEISTLTHEAVVETASVFNRYMGRQDLFGYVQGLLFPEDFSQKFGDVPEAIAALADVEKADFEKARQKYLANHNMAPLPDITLKDRLQDLVDRVSRYTVNGEPRNTTPVLARILAENNIVIAGENLGGLDLQGVNCERVDFSRCNLCDVNLRGARLAGAIFDPNTIINTNTKMANVKGEDSAIGLFACLDANRGRYVSARNPELFALWKKLRPKAQGSKKSSPPVVAEAPAQQTTIAVPSKPKGSESQKPKNPPHTNFARLRRIRTTLKRASQGALPPRQVTPPPATRSAADQFADDLERTARERRNSESQFDDAAAAHRVGGEAIEIDTSALDDFFADDGPKKPTARSTKAVLRTTLGGSAKRSATKQVQRPS